MPSNDDVVWGLSTIQCPSCGFTLNVSGEKLHKFSQQQRKQMYSTNQCNTSSSSYSRHPELEDISSAEPENTFVVITCGNCRCEQYNKIKVLRVPRLSAPSVKVDLA